jgi:hypothetical protein
MLDRRDPGHGRGAGGAGNGRGHGRSRTRTEAGYIRRLTRRADELGELLGEEHDLALLGGRLRAGRKGAAGPRLRVPRATRKLLLKLIARRRGRQRRNALKKGKRLYRHTPDRFMRRFGDAYAHAALPADAPAYVVGSAQWPVSRP